MPALEAIYLSGAALAYTRLGRPDIGLVTMSEVAETIALIRDRVATPLIVDADNGYGNALNMQRTDAPAFERAGANALADRGPELPQALRPPRREALDFSHVRDGRASCKRGGRQRASSPDTLVIARTDAIAVEGFAAAIDRAAQYAEAGADVLFVEAPGSADELAGVVAQPSATACR
jgi:2-methylisocitrate lyase-like PEP mutase family enzyme